MAKQTVNTGTVSNDGTGDNTRVSFTKLNENFDEVYISLDESNAELDQFDLHVADGALHFTQASISITESQISDLQPYKLATYSNEPVPATLEGASGDVTGMIALDTTSLYYCFQNWDASIVPATSIVITSVYEIVTVGTTNYIPSGSPDNNIGTQFTATGIGAGTGTVRLLEAIWVEMNDTVVDAHVADSAIHFINNEAVPTTPKGKLDDFKGMVAVDNTALHYCFESWDDATIINATAMVAGLFYSIATLGTPNQTDFTSYGAGSNAIGTVFEATSPGGNDGTVRIANDIWGEIELAAIIAASAHSADETIHLTNNEPTPTETGTSGDAKGMLSVSSSFFYYCFQNWDATIVSALSTIDGEEYEIVTAGDTDFTLIGAANSTPGTIFTANAVIGAGTGTARHVVTIWIEIEEAAILAATAHSADATLHFTRENIVKTSVPTLPHGIAGDINGMIAIDADYVYLCTADYVDNATVIWKRVALPAPTNATTW